MRCRQTRPLAAMLGCLCLLPGLALADCRELELGLGDFGDATFRYGRFAGVERRGGFAVLDLLLCRAAHGGEPRYWRLQGRDLALSSRTLQAEIGEQGAYRLWAAWRGLPYRQGTGRTPLRGVGGAALSLPADWVGGANTAALTRLLPDLVELAPHHERRIREAGFAQWLHPHWQWETHYRDETRDGLSVLGGVIGSNGGNARAIALPAPVDYRTREVEMRLHYTRERIQWRLGALFSRFDNAYQGLRWQNPFAGVAGWHPATGFPQGIGQLALPPDNRHLQLSAAVGADLSPRTRLTADLALGRSTQDQAFLPYSANPVLAASIVQPLPRDAFDGRIDTTRLALRLDSRPGERWRWQLGYRHDDRDNRSPRDEYVGLGADAQAQDIAPDSGQRRFNLPLGYRERQLSASLGHRPSRRWRWEAGAEHRRIDRTWSARSDSEETRLRFELRGRVEARLAGGLRLLASERSGGTYLGSRTFLDSHAAAYTDTVAGGFENLPGLRQFHLADRSRQQGVLFAQWMPSDALTLALDAGRLADDYDASEFGLRDSRIRNLMLSASYAPAGAWSGHGFIARERLAFEQAGRSFLGGANRLPQANDPDRDWFVDHRDRVTTFGAGIAREVDEGRLRLRADVAQSRTRGAIVVGTGAALASAPLPETGARLRTLDLGADWRLTAAAALRLRYRVEDFAGADWALDGVAPNTLANVILLGGDSPDYRAHVLMLSLRWRLP